MNPQKKDSGAVTKDKNTQKIGLPRKRAKGQNYGSLMSISIDGTTNELAIFQAYAITSVELKFVFE